MPIFEEITVADEDLFDVLERASTMLKLRTYNFEPGGLSRSYGAKFSCHYGVMLDLDPEFEYYFWNTEAWEKVKGHRCWVPMFGLTSPTDVFTVPDFPEEAKDYVLHVYMSSGLRGLMLGPV